MSKRIFLNLLLCAVVSACNAQEKSRDIIDSEPSATGAISMRTSLSELKHKIVEVVSEIKQYGKPKVVKRGAMPEIIIKGNKIVINSQLVGIGQPLALWKKALAGMPRCDKNLPDISCDWDEFGISLLTANSAVSQFTIYIAMKNVDRLIAALGTDAPASGWRPKYPFPGYFELDGYGIDAKTTFKEIRSNVSSERSLDCGALDCSHPYGAFDESASLFLTLNRNSENGTLYEFAVGGDKELIRAATSKGLRRR
jgi:hypothetical protein